MQPHQTRFPYVLITTSEEVVDRARQLAVNGVEEARGIYAFQADLKFEDVRDKLAEGMHEVGLIQAENYQYLSARGDLARLFAHLS